MTRDQALRNLLKSIFGNITISESNGEIVKGVSLYANCNYSIKSYNNFRRLFKLAFIAHNPMYSDSSPFDSEKAIINAKKYLSTRGITIPNHWSDEKQREKIFDILDSFLNTIIIGKQGDSSSDAKNKDITALIIRLIKDTQEKLLPMQVLSYHDKLGENNPFYNEIIDSHYKYHECNYSIKFECSNVSSYQMLRILRNLQILIPSSHESDFQQEVITNENLPLEILSGRFNSNGNTENKFQSYPVHFFDDENELSTITKWRFLTYVNEKEVITNSKSVSLSNVLYRFTEETTLRAGQEIEEKFMEKLKPFWEVNRHYLENLITSIMSLQKCKNFFDDDMSIQNQKELEEFLHNVCEKIFWDFENPYLLIEQAYQEDKLKGLYIPIQNLVIELTEILNNRGSDFANQFKDMLSTDSFRNHKNYIKKIINSNAFYTLKNIEIKFTATHEKQFKKPESVMDYFFFLRKNTFYNFQSSLYKYLSDLEKINSKS